MYRRFPLLNWLTAFGDLAEGATAQIDEKIWQTVEVPHNWEDYHGYHAVSHGNLHGTAWYRTSFSWPQDALDGERLYAFFEGVGSYADVFCNGVEVGRHAGGRTSFTVDLTSALKAGENVLAVRARHPEKITDLPFVCGGCWGAPNTEGSQPFGMFRPAWLEHTGPVRIEPFGVHIVMRDVNPNFARVEVRTELSNPDFLADPIEVHTVLLAPDGTTVAELKEKVGLECQGKKQISQQPPLIRNPQLWGPGHPHLYRAVTTLRVNGRVSHQIETTFGLRWLKWPAFLQSGGAENPPGGITAASVSNQKPVQPEMLQPRIEYQNESAPVGLVGPKSIVRLQEATLPKEASFALELNLRGRPGAEANLFCEIQDQNGTVFFHQNRARLCFTDQALKYEWAVPPVHSPRLWTREDPYLHRVNIELRSPVDDRLWERAEMFFGIREKDGPLNLAPPKLRANGRTANSHGIERNDKVLRINGEPLFINGTSEYENLLGCDHAFTDEQIAADVAMMMSAGFNAFRDAHHPHNLRYYDHWDRLGVVCWTQMGSHIWFDNPGFRENFKRLVAEWVRERRNHPCIILWGIQNESAMPEDFVEELRGIIRELDPSSPVWRPTTTCNGGRGSDWNVPQDWCGTYGGNCNDYDLEARQLTGEYGAWRRFGVHRECEYRGDENDWSETWACYAMETKIRLGEAARHRAIGQFHWIYNTFPNPGRTADTCEGPGNAAIGSVNNKGLVTAWHQPSDLYYLFRANYADPTCQPMVYIVSHTWPDRWREPGPRTVHVFSNCEEVELFNGVGVRSLGTRRQPGRGRHFVWEHVAPQTNLLQAVGRIGGKEAARDLIVLDYLPADETLAAWLGEAPKPAAAPGRALFRVSCGADADVTDAEGHVWLADRPWDDAGQWGWISWGNRFDNVAPDLASRGFTMVPVRGTPFQELYRTYRYGRKDLKYRFKTKTGRYVVRLHFTEPWFGVGGGLDATGLRLFDIAINEATVAADVDVWKEAGGDHRALTREYQVSVNGDILEIHFPKIRVGQAILSAIEVFES